MPRPWGRAFQLEQKSSGEDKQSVFKEQNKGQCSWSIISRRKSGWTWAGRGRQSQISQDLWLVVVVMEEGGGVGRRRRKWKKRVGENILYMLASYGQLMARSSSSSSHLIHPTTRERRDCHLHFIKIDCEIRALSSSHFLQSFRLLQNPASQLNHTQYDQNAYWMLVIDFIVKLKFLYFFSI